MTAGKNAKQYLDLDCFFSSDLLQHISLQSLVDPLYRVPSSCHGVATVGMEASVDGGGWLNPGLTSWASSAEKSAVSLLISAGQ